MHAPRHRRVSIRVVAARLRSSPWHLYARQSQHARASGPGIRRKPQPSAQFRGRLARQGGRYSTVSYGSKLCTLTLTNKPTNTPTNTPTQVSMQGTRGRDLEGVVMVVRHTPHS